MELRCLLGFQGSRPRASPTPSAAPPPLCIRRQTGYILRVAALRDVREFSLAIMGDLHLEPAQMPLFHEARRQIRTALRHSANPQLADGLMPPGSRVVQLGDLGGYTNAPGSRRISAAGPYLHLDSRP